MTVAFDAFSASASGSTNRSVAHNPVGTPRGAAAWLVSSPGSDKGSSATYAGIAMSEVSGSPNTLAGGETGHVSCFFLGSSVPANDPATVAINLTGDGGENILYVVTVTAAADTQIQDSDGTINSTSSANPSVTLSLGGNASFCAIGFWSGQDDVTGIAPLSGWTSRSANDISTELQAFYTYDTVDTADVTAGWTQAAEDAVAIAIAISEVAGGAAAFIKMVGNNFRLAGLGGLAS